MATIYHLPPSQPVPEVTLQQAASVWYGRQVDLDEVAGEVDANGVIHDFPTQRERPYLITISEGFQHRRTVRHAHCWSECWMNAVSEFGKACVSCVRPI